MFGDNKKKRTPPPDGQDSFEGKIKETPDGEGIENDQLDDPDGYKKDFAFPQSELDARGACVGYARFAAFKSGDSEGTLSMMSDLQGSEAFAIALVQTLSKNDKVFRYMKKMVDAAELRRKFNDSPFGDLVEMLMDDALKTASSPNPFSSGGFARRQREEMDEMREFLGVPRRDMNPLERLIQSIGERRGGRRLGGLGIEAHIIGMDGDNISSLADMLRKATGGEGCACPKCKAEREAAKETDGDTDEKQTTD